MSFNPEHALGGAAMHRNSEHPRTALTAAQAKPLLEGLWGPQPARYWADFLLSIGVGGFAFAMVRLSPLFSVQQVGFFLVAGLLYYRAAMFIHELVHLKPGTMRAFRVVWNLLCGIPFLIPSFVYYPHRDHHRGNHYGTDHDGEYLPLEHRPRWHMVAFLLQGLYIPPLAVLRFLVLTPLGWINPALGGWVYQRASSMIIDPRYQRPGPTPAERRVIRLQETACFLWCLGIASVPPLFLGRWPIPFLVHAYATAVFIVTLNALRTLGSHRWSNAGGQMRFAEQVLDSVNYAARPWITELWGPVGTRYHALHHFLPALPYHALPEAHRRLMAGLPADSPYRRTVATSLTEVLLDLWRRSGRRREEGIETVAAVSSAEAANQPRG